MFGNKHSQIVVVTVAFLFGVVAPVWGQSTMPDAPEMPQITAPNLTAPATDALAGDRAPMPVSPPENAIPETAARTPSPIPVVEPTSPEPSARTRVQAAGQIAIRYLRDGGPAIWAITGLSVLTLMLILWKIWRLALVGAWSRGKATRAVAKWENGDIEAAQAVVRGRRGLRSRVIANAMNARLNLPETRAQQETARLAKRELGDAATGLRALELIATIAPLLGLLGTVMGMITAFQALQESGNRADPALLAGGIWEALLTTAAGMAVAIPASAALTWFEAVIDRMRRDVEDAAVRVFVSGPQASEIAKKQV